MLIGIIGVRSSLRKQFYLVVDEIPEIVALFFEIISAENVFVVRIFVLFILFFRHDNVIILPILKSVITRYKIAVFDEKTPYFFRVFHRL